MLQILFVCTGNTCRSPMAQAILKDKIKHSQLDGQVAVWSAGVAAAVQAPASTGARLAMAARGIDLSNHAARQVLANDIETADLVLTMTAAHKQLLAANLACSGDKLFTLAEFAGDCSQVADPFGGSPAVYEACARQLETLLAAAWEKFVDLAGKKA